eukprot:3507166-Prymnesium_polylepis.1
MLRLHAAAAVAHARVRAFAAAAQPRLDRAPEVEHSRPEHERQVERRRHDVQHLLVHEEPVVTL